MTQPTYDRWPAASPYLTILRWLLAITGAGLMVAAFAIALPTDWMAAAHHWLGLGDFPDQPITIYLARSTSLLYAVHGFLMLIVSLNMRRYWPLVRIFGWLHVLIGLTMLGIDITTSMPWYWTAIEGLPVALAGVVLIWLWHRAAAVTID